MTKQLQILRIRILGWIAQHNDYLARRWGMTGIMRGEFSGGPNKGMPIGVYYALQKIDEDYET